MSLSELTALNDQLHSIGEEDAETMASLDIAKLTTSCK